VASGGYFLAVECGLLMAVAPGHFEDVLPKMGKEVCDEWLSHRC